MHADMLLRSFGRFRSGVATAEGRWHWQQGQRVDDRAFILSGTGIPNIEILDTIVETIPFNRKDLSIDSTLFHHVSI